MNEKRVGFVGIIVRDRRQNAPAVNRILTEFGDTIIGRIGMPYEKRKFSVIALIVDGTGNEIGALTGKLGMIKGVTVKSAMAKENE